MAVITVGDIKQQVCDITGVRLTDAQPMRAVLASLNNAVRKVRGAAQALGMPLTRQIAVPINITGATTTIPLFDGTTIADANGVIQPRCRAVHQVMLQSTGRYLTHRSLETLRVELGDYASWGRSTPQYWDAYGFNSSGQRLLWVVPLPAGADTLYTDYTCGSSRLTADAQALPVEEDDEQLIVHETVANLVARAPFDPTIIADSREQARAFWRLFFANAFGAKPPHKALERIEGMTN